MSACELVDDFMHPAIYGCLSNYFSVNEINRISVRSGIYDPHSKKYTNKAYDLGLCVRYGTDGSQVYLRVQPMIQFFRSHADLKYPDTPNSPSAATTFSADFGTGARLHPLQKI